MVMFNSFALYRRVNELSILCEREFCATIVCMCELVLLSQFHGLFINTFPEGVVGSSAGGRERVCSSVWTFECVCVCVCVFQDGLIICV